jgi:hypothetical protein
MSKESAVNNLKVALSDLQNTGFILGNELNALIDKAIDSMKPKKIDAIATDLGNFVQGFGEHLSFGDDNLNVGELVKMLQPELEKTILHWIPHKGVKINKSEKAPAKKREPKAKKNININKNPEKIDIDMSIFDIKKDKPASVKRERKKAPVQKKEPKAKKEKKSVDPNRFQKVEASRPRGLYGPYGSEMNYSKDSKALELSARFSDEVFRRIAKEKGVVSISKAKQMEIQEYQK